MAPACLVETTIPITNLNQTMSAKLSNRVEKQLTSENAILPSVEEEIVVHCVVEGSERGGRRRSLKLYNIPRTLLLGKESFGTMSIGSITQM